MDLRQELLKLVAALQQAGIDYAVCGGFAVAIHGYPRLTTDIDLLIRSVNLDAACTALATAGRRKDLDDIEQVRLRDDDARVP